MPHRLTLFAPPPVEPEPEPFVPYVYRNLPTWELRYVPFGGGTPVVVLSGTSGMNSPVASPDYEQIAYCASGGTGAPLRIVNRDGSGDMELDSGDCLFPNWHPDGSKLVYTNYDTFGEIVTINPDGTGRTVIYDTSPDFIHRPVYNHDGTLIAFNNEDADEYWVMEEDGSNPIAVASVERLDESNPVSWMHTSNVLAFVDHVPASLDDYHWRVDADGTNLAQITDTDSEVNSRLGWSADDSTFFFLKFDNTDGHYTVWSVPAAGPPASDTQVTPPFGVFVPPFLIFDDRIYASAEDSPATTTLGIASVALDGSDLRIEDADGGRIEGSF